MSETPPGLRNPWIWAQPRTNEEILARLRDCFELNVAERERENMCSVAHAEIVSRMAAMELSELALRDCRGQFSTEQQRADDAECELSTARADALREAAIMCREKGDLHARYLPRNHCYKNGDLGQAATCGRRDEAYVLADAIYALSKEQKK